MISNYLSLLYSNCKLLKKKQSYSNNELVAFFKGEIQAILLKYNLKSETELVALLISKHHAQLQELLNTSDFISIFYLINSLNEYNQSIDSYDNLGRFKFDYSIIKDYGIENNVVLNLIKKSITANQFLQNSFEICHHQSFFYLSHDIDSVYGSLTQDGLWAIKNGRIDVMMNLFFNTIIAKPHWFNFDLIMKTESEYDFKSTFYWLVNKGKIDQRQTNSDYSISSTKITDSIRGVSARGFENGLHKSISRESFKTEISKMPVNIIGNRYHYLKFQVPDAYNKIEEAGLKLDASLGFAEHYGFRNGYGYPFQPYNVTANTNYNFLEVPLNIMDGTFQRYLEIPVKKTADTIIQFLEKNSHDTLLSILWHNTFFSNYKYKGYLNEYKKILKYLYEMKFQNINQSEIIDKFSWQNK